MGTGSRGLLALLHRRVERRGAYGEHKQRNVGRLLDVSRETASGAAWKRLGFLTERLWPAEAKIIAAARRHLTTGYVRLDPGNREHGKLSKRWSLWINVSPSDLTSESNAS